MRKSYLLEYYEGIRSGEIIVGNDIRFLYENLIADLENDDFVYDTREAHFRIEFMEKFCKQTKSPFNNIPIHLMLWEKAFLEVIYSFYWTKKGYEKYYQLPYERKIRRFKKILLLVGRKNGKSTLTATDGVTELMLGEGGTDIVCSSNTDEQAKIVFNEIKNMAQKFDPKEKYLHSNITTVLNVKNNSTVTKLSERTKNKEGKNINKAYLDETNELKDNKIVEPILQSMSSKEEPQFINITTEGFIVDGYLDKEIRYIEQILSGEVIDPTCIGFLYRQDNEEEVWNDQKSWMKANPSMGVIKREANLMDSVKQAKISTEKRAFVLCKDFNVKTANATAWLLLDDVRNGLNFDEKDVEGCLTFGGFDFAETTDLASLKFMCLKKGDSTKYIIQKYFIPEIRLNMGTKEEQERFQRWKKEGLLEVSPGNENDLEMITRTIEKIIIDLNLRVMQFSIDGWHLKQWGKSNKEKLRIKEIPMRNDVLSSPMSLIEMDLKQKLINYNQNPVDEWCFLNTGLEFDKYGKMKPIKVNEDKTRKIDGMISLILCYVGYQENKGEISSYI